MGVWLLSELRGRWNYGCGNGLSSPCFSEKGFLGLRMGSWGLKNKLIQEKLIKYKEEMYKANLLSINDDFLRERREENDGKRKRRKSKLMRKIMWVDTLIGIKGNKTLGHPKIPF